jgi:hypothetical protein
MFYRLLEHAGLNDHDVFLRSIASPGLRALYFFDDVETFQHVSKDDVFPRQPRRRGGG